MTMIDKFIEKEDSFRYELDYEDTTKSLVIRTSQLFFNEAKKMLLKIDPVYLGHFAKFCGPFTQPSTKYGYREVFAIHQNNNLIELETKLPVTAKKSKDDPLGFKIDNSIAVSILGSMSLLLCNILWLAHHDLPAQADEQIISLQSILLEPGQTSGFSLSAKLHPRLFRALNKFGQAEINEVSHAMKEAEHYMFPMRSHENYYCQMVIQDGSRLHLDVAGNATGLDPESNWNTSNSYNLQPHNVDTPLQSLTLIVGLAKICQVAKRLEE